MAASLLAAFLAVPAVRHWREEPPSPPPQPQPLRTAWLPLETLELGAGSDYPFGLAVAPDGRRLAYPAAAGGAIALRLHDLATGETRTLPSTDGAAAPFWSPDASRVGFLAGGRLRAFDLASGAVSDLAEAPAGRGGAWNAAGDLIFSPTGAGGLMRRSLDGSIAPFTIVDVLAGESGHTWPAFLPDGRHVAYLVSATSRSRAGIWIAPLDEPSSPRRIASSDTQPIVAGNTLLYLNDVALMAQRVDPATWAETARPALGRRLGADYSDGLLVGMPAGRGPLAQLFATASADVLIYGAPGSALRDLRWVSRGGQTVGRAGEPTEAWDLRIAPDGRRVAVTELDPQLRTLDVWIREGSQPVPTRLSLGADVDESPVWSPDGTRVAWAAARRQVMSRGAGAVLPEQLMATFDPPLQVWDWSHDSQFLLVGRTHPGTRDDLWIVPQADGNNGRPYAAGDFNQNYGVFSPNGRWIAYASDESGKFDVYIDRFPTPGSRIRVTTAGGTEPRWRRDGRELYFRRGSAIHVVGLAEVSRQQPDATSAIELEIRSSERLFDAGARIRAYDASPDGTRFLVNVPAVGAAPRAMTMVVNWQTNTPHGNTETRKP